MRLNDWVRNVPMLLCIAFIGHMLGNRQRPQYTHARREVFLLRGELERQQADFQAAKQEREQLRALVFDKQTKALDLEKVVQSLNPAEAEVHNGEDLVEVSRAVDILRTEIPCRDVGTPTTSTDLPIFVLVVGIEGAGHHAMETVWHGLEEFYDLHFIGYNPGLHSFAKEADVSKAYQYSSADFERHRKQIRNLLKKPWVRGKKLIIDSRDSYPEGFGVGALAHPDLLYLSMLDGDVIDLRVLVMSRDIVDCTMSAVRRFQVGEFQYKNAQFQARAVSENLALINNALRSIPCGKYMVLPYEKFVHQPKAYSAQLSELLSVQKQYMDQCFHGLKAPSDKTYTEEQQQERKLLQTFFERQRVLFPILADPSSVPKVHIRGGPIPTKSATASAANDNKSNKDPHTQKQQDQLQPIAAQQQQKQQEGWVTQPDKYLLIDWFLHLGFNNVRFIMEMAFGMAHALERTLVLPSHLRMRQCDDASLCSMSKCEVRENKNYWCPLSMFLDQDVLVSSGGMIVRDHSDFQRGKQVERVSHAFKEVYNSDHLWLSMFTPDAAKTSATIEYQRFHLGCELSYFKTVKQTWQVSDPSLVHAFSEEYNRDADVLYLQGTPHKIGVTPFVWPTAHALEEYQKVWNAAVVYHPSIVHIAKQVSNALVRDSPTNSFVCVHLRRGDFVTAGWLGQAKDLELVANNIKTSLIQGELFYLATDEQDTTVLAGLRDIGARVWSDVFPAVTPPNEDATSMLGFQDYVGLVEQMICGQARRFLGSKCSSFTGGILNLRRQLVGDTSYTSVVSKPKSNNKH
eukprot:m.149849 g.149849  ORF g.149849 m.149849 type:complete len:799 (-) comp14209_c0_seq2:251-2647(-)